MPAEARDPAYLWDMLDAALAIQEFTAGGTFDDYSRNKMMRSAVERQLEILGEAARRAPDGFKGDHPEIAWRQIVGLATSWRTSTATSGRNASGRSSRATCPLSSSN